jgi:hypothetical protein
MTDPNEVLAEARTLERAGKIQEADDLITAYFKEQAAAGHPVAGVEEQPKPPRAPAEVTLDLLSEIVAALGNKQTMLDKLVELTPPKEEKPPPHAAPTHPAPHAGAATH